MYTLTFENFCQQITSITLEIPGGEHKDFGADKQIVNLNAASEKEDGSGGGGGHGLVKQKRLRINIGGMSVAAETVILPKYMLTRQLQERSIKPQPLTKKTPYLPITCWSAGGPPGAYHSFLNNANLVPRTWHEIDGNLPHNPGPNSVQSYLNSESLKPLAQRSESLNASFTSPPLANKGFSAVTPRSNAGAKSPNMRLQLQLNMNHIAPSRPSSAQITRTGSSGMGIQRTASNNHPDLERDALVEASKRLLAREEWLFEQQTSPRHRGRSSKGVRAPEITGWSPSHISTGVSAQIKVTSQIKGSSQRQDTRQIKVQAHMPAMSMLDTSNSEICAGRNSRKSTAGYLLYRLTMVLTFKNF